MSSSGRADFDFEVSAPHYSTLISNFWCLHSSACDLEVCLKRRNGGVEVQSSATAVADTPDNE
ncbi:hypothetical protein E2C01_037980 [Portunus trituberculatus]|uniref:Uncharacterized protein n=1 Tax=Portunus trituberculatus TaxID=210409 RepID=A0A5B7FFK0_PORTR|nr:hypothetical protein [Portunus trituberculatus]